jgi:hypothetical protein
MNIMRTGYEHFEDWAFSHLGSDMTEACMKNSINLLLLKARMEPPMCKLHLNGQSAQVHTDS